MNNPSKGRVGYTPPAVWKYILGAVVAFPFIFLLWVITDLWALRPELADIDVGTTMDRVRWFGVPLLVVLVLFGGNWALDRYAAHERERTWHQKTQQLKDQESLDKRSQQSARGYTLEVLGLGITVEQYRQGKLWQILQHGGPHTSIREPDPEKYPWTDFDKMGQTGSRACDALENGADLSPMFWGVPTLYASGPIHDPELQPSDISPMAGLASSAEGTGMAWHLFATGPWQLDERPDRLLEQAFSFFDTYPDLPYLILLSSDSDFRRDRGRPVDTERLVQTGYYIPKYSDASAVFVLAKRERVEPVRPYVWDDPENDYLQENLRHMYFGLEKTSPAYGVMKEFDPEMRLPRQPTVAEWLPAAAAFAKNPVFYHKESTLLDTFKRWTKHPPKDWKSTPWFPLPWNRNQMEAFDRLPSLGFVHRPVFVDFKDEHGKPVKDRATRQKILEAGWQQALQTLPDAERTAGPSRIIAAFDNNTEHMIALEGMLHNYKAAGGPEIDSGKTAQFINTDRRMGNTGAATFFVQMAVGVMGSYIDGGTSAAINLRDPSGASLVFISPPSQEKRQAQGENVFKHIVEPSIDPKNYEQPALPVDTAQAETVAD